MTTASRPVERVPASASRRITPSGVPGTSRGDQVHSRPALSGWNRPRPSPGSIALEDRECVEMAGKRQLDKEAVDAVVCR